MSKRATWIWYPGDFEVWLGNRFNNRRTERGSMFPPFWKQDSHWPTVAFAATVDLAVEETVAILCEGRCNLAIDGRLTAFADGLPVTIPAGRHRLTLKVWNQQSPPALFIDGPTVKTGPGWTATYEDKIWIDELGVAHGSGVYVPVGYGLDSPLHYNLPTRPLAPVGGGAVYDFGRETFGYLLFHGLRGEGVLRVFYGESREEALDHDRCETLDVCRVTPAACSQSAGRPLFGSKAFRYVSIAREGTVDFDALTMLEEYAPFDEGRSGTFRCSDDELNRIWQVSARTLDLTTREFFCDGIKRDRWVWSGDAIQSYLMNYYLRFDTGCVRRTIRQLRGKDPVTAHVNTIMDYTFYWFKSIADYYLYTADRDFVGEMWPRMVTLMDYAVGRATDGCMAEGRADDWIFVDWADFPMGKHGVLAFEQILFWKALQTMEHCARLLGHDAEAEKYAALARKVHEVTDRRLYSPDRQAYIHALENSGTDERRYREDTQVTPFPNIFALIYDFCSQETKAKILHSVLLNADVPAITTPYMRFYELEALCQMGLQARVLAEMKSYWGGMLRLGATTFWEKYNPEEQGAEHLAMYGRPYGKSLCHAWGASPIYIIGRYFLGVSPVKPGYEEYEVRPVLGGMEWMEGNVPTPFGKIHVRMDRKSVTVSSDGGHGTLIVGNRRTDIPAGESVTLDC